LLYPVKINSVSFRISKIKRANELFTMVDKGTKRKRKSSLAEQLTPTAQAAKVLSELYKFSGEKEELEKEIKRDLERKTEAVKAGDLSSVEEVMIAQLNIVNGMIAHYAIHTNSFYSGSGITLRHPQVVQTTEQITDLLTKLFNTSVKISRAIGDLKRPKNTTFIKTHVDKQLNQLLLDRDLENNSSSKNKNIKTLEAGNGAQVDGGAKRETATVNKKLETMEVEYRAEDDKRQRN